MPGNRLIDLRVQGFYGPLHTPPVEGTNCAHSHDISLADPWDRRLRDPAAFESLFDDVLP